MTALNLATDIPSSIDTVEKLHAWTALVLNHLYYNQTVIENVDAAVRPAQSAPFEITASDPIVWRLISRTSLQLHRDYQKTGKPWQHIQTLGSAMIPSEFKS